MTRDEKSQEQIKDMIEVRMGYGAKRSLLLSRFSKEFVDMHYNYDGFFMSTVQLLLSGGDPYKVIEGLLVIRNQLAKQLLDQSDCIRACQTVVFGYESNGMENMDTRDNVFYTVCKEALEKID